MEVRLRPPVFSLVAELLNARFFMDEMCKTEDCPEQASTNYSGLAVNLFAKSGRDYVKGYCDRCAARRLSNAWLMGVGLLCLVAGISQLPDWTPLVVGCAIFGGWYWGLRGRWRG